MNSIMGTRGLGRRGNAVIEAVLVIPILLLLAFGTVEFGHFFFVKHNLQGAAREGARAAIVSGATNADVSAAVSASLTAAGLQGSGYTVTTNPSDVSTAASGTNVSVAVKCSWGNVGVRPMGMISATKQAQGTTVMRKE
jgi:Flp pilus assembly protein TadG